METHRTKRDNKKKLKKDSTLKDLMQGFNQLDTIRLDSTSRKKGKDMDDQSSLRFSGVYQHKNQSIDGADQF